MSLTNLLPMPELLMEQSAPAACASAHLPHYEQDDITAHREAFDRGYAQMQLYLRQVGLARFSAEQYEADKIMWALNIIHDEDSELDPIHTELLQEHFDRTPLCLADDMLRHIRGYVALMSVIDASQASALRRLLPRLRVLVASHQGISEMFGRRHPAAYDTAQGELDL